MPTLGISMYCLATGPGDGGGESSILAWASGAAGARSSARSELPPPFGVDGRGVSICESAAGDIDFASTDMEDGAGAASIAEVVVACCFSASAQHAI